MIVTCEQCQARFKLADEKVKPEGTKVRCSKCQSIFTVSPPPAPAEPEQTGEGAPPAVATEAAKAALPETEQPVAEPPADAASSGSGSGELDFDFAEQGQERSGDEQEEACSPESSMTDDSQVSDGFDFESTFAEEDTTHPSVTAAAGESDEYDFGDAATTAEGIVESAAQEFDFSLETPGESPAGEFDFDEVEAAADGGGFDFTVAPEGPAASDENSLQEFDLSTEDSTFGEINFSGEESDFSLGGQPGAEGSAFGQDASSWGTPADAEPDSFDFEEPQFSGPAVESEIRTDSLSFGEIDFSDDDNEAALPSFDSSPEFAAPPEPPPETFPSRPPETAVTPPPGQPAERPRREPQIPAPPLPRRSPISRMVVVLGVLLLVLCGAGGYLYVSGDGERLINQAVMKIKGENPAGPVEQLISLGNIVTSYVDNREAGQLLVVQGTATNNFPTPRSAIAVKGLLLDTSGKVVMQQTVYCGNYLKEEKLRTLPFAAIQEAMSNQIGDSLSNMNVKPGVSLKFTIVFRNVPENIANINFEVTDSKPGSS